MFNLDIPPVVGPCTEIASESKADDDLLTGLQNITEDQLREYDNIDIDIPPVVDSGTNLADDDPSESNADIFNGLQSITEEQLRDYYDMLDTENTSAVGSDTNTAPDSSESNTDMFIGTQQHATEEEESSADMFSGLKNITEDQLRDYYDNIDRDTDTPTAKAGSDTGTSLAADDDDDDNSAQPNADIFIGIEHTTEEERQDYDKLKDLAAKVARARALRDEFEAQVGSAKDFKTEPWTAAKDEKADQLEQLELWVAASKKEYNELSALLKLRYSRDV